MESLPTPAEQLAMINRRREAKKSRAGQVTHSFIIFFDILDCSLTLIKFKMFKCVIFFKNQLAFIETLLQDSDYLRTFDVLQRIRVQDGWSVEIRKRTSGKAAGQTYKVWVTPSGGQLWSKLLVVVSSNLSYVLHFGQFNYPIHVLCGYLPSHIRKAAEAAGFTWWAELERAQKACTSDSKHKKADGDTEGDVAEPEVPPPKKRKVASKKRPSRK